MTHCSWRTEPGLNRLEVFQTPITCWDDLLQACAEIAEGKHEFKTIVVDTVDNAYKMCSDYVCKKFKIEHESDLGYGKGYALINNEFQRVINKLAFLPYGLILISHSQERDIETRTGKHTRIVPTLPEKARKLVTGLVDLILFCDLDIKTGEDGKPVWQRVMRTKPSPNYDAGDRTGRLPEVIPLDFPSFMKAFNNTAAGAAASAGPAASGADRECGGETPTVRRSDHGTLRKSNPTVTSTWRSLMTPSKPPKSRSVSSRLSPTANTRLTSTGSN